MEQLVTTLEQLKANTKVTDKTTILENVEDETTKRVLNFLGDPNQVIGLSTKKNQQTRATCATRPHTT